MPTVPLSAVPFHMLSGEQQHARMQMLNIYPALLTEPLQHDWPTSSEPNVIEIQTDNVPEERRHVATITFDPSFTEDAVMRWGWLFSRAPELWEALRKLATSINDIELENEVTEAMRLLWDISVTNPYGIELEHRRHDSNESLAKLPPAMAKG